MPAKHADAQSIGRRKNASARVYLSRLEEENEDGDIVVNGRKFDDYFARETMRQVVLQPLVISDRLGRYQFKVNVRGGGKSGQAGAVLLGIARALEKIEPDLRGALKKAGFLTRDPRIVERKKPGRHKARKRPQFSKR